MEPNANPGGPAEFSAEQRSALEVHRADQDRTLAAVHALEAALGAAAPGRAEQWRDDVRAALEVLGEAAAEEQRNAARPDSLLSDIARSQRRLRHRMHGLRAQYRHVCDTIEALRLELDADPRELDVTDLRRRLGWLIGALRYQRARESDLLYEAYYDAFNRDLARDTAAEP